MKGEKEQINDAVMALGKEVAEENGVKIDKAGSMLFGSGVSPREAMGMSDQAVEGIYGQAYRLYNAGKYKEASQLFRLLLMLNSGESKFALGLAACFHM